MLKKDKSEVDFEHPAKGPHHCHSCQHWLPPDACQLVAGTIQAGDWCKLFLAQKSKQNSPLQAFREVLADFHNVPATTEDPNPPPKSVHALPVQFEAAAAAPAAAPPSSGANPVSAGSSEIKRDKVPHPKKWLDDLNLLKAEEDDGTDGTDEEENSEKKLTGKKSQPAKKPLIGGMREVMQERAVTISTTTQ